MENSTKKGRKVAAKIVGAEGTGIMVCTGGTTLVVDVGATSITEVWDFTVILYPAKKSSPD
jgi:hypothetical protein